MADLLARLRALGLEVPEGSVFRRTYAGRVQRAEGAWSWYLEGPGGLELGIGSQCTRARLTAGRIMVIQHWNNLDLHVDPWEFVSEDARGDFRLFLEETVTPPS